MSPTGTPTSPSPAPFRSLLMEAYSRRLLLHTPIYKSPTDSASPVTTSSPPQTDKPLSSFDENVITILAIVLCAMIGALAMNTMVRLVLRYCTSNMWFEPDPEPDPEPEPGLAARLAQAGFKRKAVKALPTLVYSTVQGLPGGGSDCVICLTEFMPGDRVRVLPECGHGFHAACVDRWLASRSTCPTCRQGLFGPCGPVIGCATPTTGRLQSSTVVPLDREEVMITCPLSESVPPGPPISGVAPLDPKDALSNQQPAC